MAGHVPEWLRGSMAKTSAATPKQGVKQMGSLFHGTQSKEPKGEVEVEFYADGGQADEATLKAEGLAASADDKVGLWERLKAGNIDDPNSEAYRRWGAGKGQEMRTSATEDARDKELTRLYNERAAVKPADDRNEMDKASDAAPASKPATATVSTPKFGEAFAAARKSGAKDFEWNGKKYTTALKSPAAAPDDRNEMDKQSDAAASRNYRNEMDKESDKFVSNKGGAAVGTRLGRAAARKREQSAK